MVLFLYFRQVKKSLFLLIFLFLMGAVRAQYWQQRADYRIDVRLNGEEKTLDGFARITYTNHSPDTLTYIWFHLWPNAYRNDRTAFSDQLLEQGSTRFYFSPRGHKGYINRLQFRVNNTAAHTEDHPQHIDIVKLLLPAPLLPGAQAVITTPFHVQLPLNVSRGGWDGSTFQATQWYPKPAVYDRKGWHPMPYLDQGEFYSEFGDYDVRITLPRSYLVAATGHLQNPEEKEWMLQQKGRTAQTAAVAKTPRPRPQTKNRKPVSARVPLPPRRQIDTAVKTLQYLQKDIHDFAWFASRDFRVAADTCVLPSGKVVEVLSYSTPAQEPFWKNGIAYCKEALRFYSSEIGDYPYDLAQVVQGPESISGGMEYPTLAALSPMDDAKELDLTIAHEIGHNWFYGALASNERAHPWLDEGLNTYYEYKYARLRYPPRMNWEELLFRTAAARRRDQPIIEASGAFSRENYGLTTYHKAARWMEHLEGILGPEKMRGLMQEYYRRWQFRHPQPDDFTALVQSYGGGAALPLLSRKGLLPGLDRKGWKVMTPFSGKRLAAYSRQPDQHVLFLSPLAGYNQYDRLMAGALITNYFLPPSRFRFMLAPLYGTNSKEWNGTGQLNYAQYREGRLHKMEVNLLGSTYSYREGKDTLGNKLFQRFYKIVPSARITFRGGPRSTRRQTLEWKTFFIGEGQFERTVRFSEDSLLYQSGLKYGTRTLHQATFFGQDTRALYPYDYELQLQRGNGFYRVNLTGNYFFNYGEHGGLQVRSFFSKFGEAGDKGNTFLGRYQPKLLGVTGEEDYTYSNYFLGRSASAVYSEESAVRNEGLAARQIMIRDGGFRMRMDYFGFLQGQSGNWVGALNFTSSLPQGFVPSFMPLRLFLDLGTYAEAWEQENEGSRIYYTAGLQLSLLKGALNVYAPLLFSREYRENLKTLPEENTFFRRMTFSIDLKKLDLHAFTGRSVFF